MMKIKKAHKDFFYDSNWNGEEMRKICSNAANNGNFSKAHLTVKLPLKFFPFSFCFYQRRHNAIIIAVELRRTMFQKRRTFEYVDNEHLIQQERKVLFGKGLKGNHLLANKTAAWVIIRHQFENESSKEMKFIVLFLAVFVLAEAQRIPRRLPGHLRPPPFSRGNNTDWPEHHGNSTSHYKPDFNSTDSSRPHHGHHQRNRRSPLSPVPRERLLNRPHRGPNPPPPQQHENSAQTLVHELNQLFNATSLMVDFTSIPKGIQRALEASYDRLNRVVNETIAKGFGRVQASLVSLNETALSTVKEIQAITLLSTNRIKQEIAKQNATVQSCINKFVPNVDAAVNTARDKAVTCVNKGLQNGTDIARNQSAIIVEEVGKVSNINDTIEFCQSNYFVGCYIGAIIQVRAETVSASIKIGQRFAVLSNHVDEVSPEIVKCSAVVGQAITSQAKTLSRVIIDCINNSD